MRPNKFQRDNMKMSVPTDIVDEVTLQKIDEFSDKYRENVENYKCKCGKCTGFGSGQFKGEYKNDNKKEMFHKYEYPGMHQSLLWAVSAASFYLTIKLKNVYSINCRYSCYRCWSDSSTIKYQTTNHMGKAVDLHFNKNKERTKDVLTMDLIREKIFCEYIGAPIQGNNSNYRFGWLQNKFGLEPAEFKKGDKDGAQTWIHIDVREFNNILYLKDDCFIKKNSDGKFSIKLDTINNN